MISLNHDTKDSMIENFLRKFELNAASGDTAAAVAQFAEVFLAGGPEGARAVRSSDFALALPKRKQIFDGLGCRPATLVALEKITVDERYVLAKTRWRMEFVREGEDTISIEAGSAFLVDTGQEPFRIVLYLASQDIFAVMRERGILPREASGPS
jgi:hypothetical protein